MEDFASHADHCPRCRDAKPSRGLCNRGNSLARTMAEYVYQKNGLAFAVQDKLRKNETVRLELPPTTRRIDGEKFDMQPVRNLLAAANNGLDIQHRGTPSPPPRRHVELHQPTRSSSVRRPTERRPEADIVMISPAGKREERLERRREAEGRPRTAGRGSLYREDAENRERRSREAVNPIIVVAEPRRSSYR